jgi:CubicO group peptidase (beta-lactamase class C family)
VRTAALGACALLAACAGNPVAPQSHAEVDRELAAIVGDPQRPLASLSALVIRDGHVIYEGHFGRRWIDPDGRGGDKPVTAETLYRIASISKMVTAIGALRLVEDDKLDLDKDIGDYLGFPVRNPAFPDVPITARMLMTHTSSLRDDAGYFNVAVRDVLAQPAAWSPRAKPGAFFQYANLPWGILGTVMESVSGERFDHLMKRLVIDPLALSGGYNPAELSPHALANLASLYRKATAGDVQVWDPQGPWVPQTDDYSRRAPVVRTEGYKPGTNAILFGPQGGLRASAADLGRVMRMLMNGGELDGRRILRPATVDMMLATQWRQSNNGESDYGTSKGRFQAWGLGNQVFMDVGGPDYGDRFFEGGGFRGNGHTGDAYGLIGTFAFDRERKVGFLFLAGGTGFDPATERGTYSGYYRFEERILTTLRRVPGW